MDVCPSHEPSHEQELATLTRARIATLLQLPPAAVSLLSDHLTCNELQQNGQESLCWEMQVKNADGSLRPSILLKVEASMPSPVVPRRVTRSSVAKSQDAAKRPLPSVDWSLCLGSASLCPTSKTNDLVTAMLDPFLLSCVMSRSRTMDFTYLEPNGHWKNSFTLFDSNLYILTDDIWHALLADGWMPEYVLLLTLAGVIMNNDGVLPK
jgi:hypothetical protein